MSGHDAGADDGATGDIPVGDGLDHTGAAPIDAELDGFHQPTAMFDRGQFLGELADLVDGSPDTRALVEAEQQAAPGGCRLIVVSGPDIGQAWSFKSSIEIVIGRDDDCALTLQDIAVSRRHARIWLEGLSFAVEDLDSNNGTYLNGDSLDGRAPLTAGDELVIGERTLRFVELNEAPATEAQLPVHPGRASGTGSKDLEPGEGGGWSQIHAHVGEEDLDAPVVAPVPVAEPGSGRALRRTLLTGAAILSVVVLLAVGWVAWQRHVAAEAAEEAARLARVRFLQAIELVKAERFGDAQRVLRNLRQLDPEHPRADAYLAHVAWELGRWKKLEQARALAREARFSEAIDLLESVEPESAYADDAARLARSFEQRIGRSLLEEARKRLAAGDYDAATRLVAAALERAPGSPEARLLLDQIEAARQGARPVIQRKKAFEIPPVLIRSVGLYRQGKIAPAIDAAEAAGTELARAAVERMKKMDGLLDDLEHAHRKKAAAELLRDVPRALELDASIAGGEGDIRARLVRYFADGLYLKGIEALQDHDEPKAFRLFAEALGKRPDHRLAKTRLAELQGRAREIYYQARVLEESDADQAKSLYERLTRMTEPSNDYHKLARKWLRSHG